MYRESFLWHRQLFGEGSGLLKQSESSRILDLDLSLASGVSTATQSTPGGKQRGLTP